MTAARNLYVIPSFVDETCDLYIDSRGRRTEPTENDNLIGIAIKYLLRLNVKRRETE